MGSRPYTATMRRPCLLLLVSPCMDYVYGLSCKDEAGQDVDWWILYKLPKLEKAHSHRTHIKPLLEDGLAYAFLTSSMPDTQWTMSSLSIADSGSLPGQTLVPLYSGLSSMFHVMYN